MLRQVLIVGVAVLAAGGGTAVATASGNSDGTVASVKTVTVYRNSPTCVKGYVVAGHALALAGRAMGDASAYPPLVYRVAEAAIKRNVAEVDHIVGETTIVNTKIAGVARQLKVLNARFHPSGAGCH